MNIFSRPPLAESSSVERSSSSLLHNETRESQREDTFGAVERSGSISRSPFVATLLPKPTAEPKTEAVIIKDAALHALFLEAGVNLTELWDNLQTTLNEHALDTVVVEAADANLEVPGARSLSEDAAKLLGEALASIHAFILDNPTLPPVLKEGVGRYFTLESFEARLHGGDEYLLSVPATPLKILTMPGGGERCQTFEKISQSSAAFEVLNPSVEIHADPEIEVSFPHLKKWFINYLQASGRVLSLVNEMNAHPLEQIENFQNEKSDEKASLKDIQVRGEDTLRELDNRHFMRTERDQQGGHGYCWTFTASRLAEEQVCKQAPDSPECGERLSPLDTSYDQWRFAEKSEGGPIRAGLQNILDHGVCGNDRAHYPTEPEELQIVDHLNEYFLALREEGGAIQDADWKTLKVLSYDVRTKNFGSHPLTLDNELLGAVRTVHEQSQSWWRPWQWPLAYSAADNPLGSTLAATVSTLGWGSASISRALRDTFIGKECTDNRIKAPFETLSQGESKFYFSTRAQRLESLKTVLEYGNSVGVGMCVASQVGQKGCFPHAVVLDATRYDRENDKWEGHFINSWGEDSTVMNGWKDLGEVVDDFLVLNHYVPKGTEG